jgi:hypothetical protein
LALQLQFSKCLYLDFLYFRFDGRIVARLPFVPISWIQGLSHRNLPGDDYTECSFIFLYILCTMSIRQVSEVGAVNVRSMINIPLLCSLFMVPRLSARFYEAAVRLCIFI